MATYTETAQGKPSIGLAVWLAVVAFAVAAAVVLALVAFGGDSSPLQSTTGGAQTTGFGGQRDAGAYGIGTGTTGSHVTGSTGSGLIRLGNGICARCAP
jgi:hypothetical protein